MTLTRFRVAPLCIVAVAGLTLGALVAPAPAQPLPFDVTAQNVTSTTPITSYIEAAAGELASGDRDKVVAARQALLAPVAGSSAAKPSPQFLTVYAREIVPRLDRVLAGNNPHAKLNAAIVVQRVADQSNSPSLSPLVVRLMNDSSPAVATFGVRAAGDVLPVVLANKALAQNDTLVDAIIACVKKNPTSEGVVNEAYVALTQGLQDKDLAALIGPQGVAAATPRISQAIQQLINDRVAQFGDGNVTEPLAEQPGVGFLTRQANWALLSKPQQVETVKSLLALLNAAAKEMTAEQDKKPPSPRRLGALRDLVKGTSQGLGVIADVMAKPELKAATDQAKPLGLSTPIAEYKRVIAEITIAGNKAFTNAATQPAGAAAAAPATGTPAATR